MVDGKGCQQLLPTGFFIELFVITLFMDTSQLDTLPPFPNSPH